MVVARRSTWGTQSSGQCSSSLQLISRAGLEVDGEEIDPEAHSTTSSPYQLQAHPPGTNNW
ncbi:hypothetical protein E2562_004109 [Oryza meyeriana var. granulata]|uniref:Uncharacterized protein n=1 Tax=Oryza meyeriana var. granulata TaxID=110450 RepID=A0A6G1EV32_9ORYZ|nr:hypothetical protein E2562_004109 [Oryza meyeriana var. granulata]